MNERDVTLEFGAPDRPTLKARIIASAKVAADTERWVLAATLYRAVAELELEEVMSDRSGADAAWEKRTVSVPLARSYLFGSDAHGGAMDGVGSRRVGDCVWPVKPCTGHPQA